MSAEHLLRLLEEQQMIDDRFLRKLHKSVAAADKPVSPEKILRLLVDREKITPAQATVLTEELAGFQHTPKPDPERNHAKKTSPPESSKRKPPKKHDTHQESITAPASKAGLILAVVGTVAFAGGLAAFVMLRDAPAPDQQPVVDNTPISPPSDDGAPDEIATPVVPAQVDFQMGEQTPDTKVESIRVVLHVADDGAMLDEAVDLHLGVGFPLRMYPLGTNERSPTFAAFPQKSSLAGDEHSVAPGDSAMFEFAAQPVDHGLDELQTTPKLFADLTVGDIQTVGFASRGETDWVLAGYEIEINGAPLVIHRQINQAVNDIQEDDRIKLEESLPQLKAMEQELRDQEVFAKLSKSEKDQADLEAKRKAVDEFSRPVTEMAGRIAGTHPWFIDRDPRITLSSSTDSVKAPISVSLIPASDESPGTRNPLYLKVGGKKFPISSPSQPFADETTLQQFSIVPVSAAAPVIHDQFAIGMLGHDEPFDQTPDRARFQRVLIRAGEEIFYDSDTQPGDNDTLRQVSLSPPVHRDANGSIVTNSASPHELFVWQPGYEAPSVTVDTPTYLSQAADPAAGTTTPVPPAVPLAAAGLPPEPKREPILPVKAGPILASREPLKLAPAENPQGTGTTLPPKNSKPLNTQRPPGNQRPIAPPVGVTPLNAPRLAGPPNLMSALIQHLLDRRSESRQRPRRTVARKSRKTDSANNIPKSAARSKFKPPSSNLVKAGKRKVSQKPQPGKPLITDVRFRSPRGMAVDGRPITVQWTAVGETSSVSHYRVDLQAIMPDQRRYRLPEPLAQDLNARNGTSTLTPSVATIIGRNIQTQDRPYLYVQPEVRAMKADGTTLAIQAGPILPLFPDGNSVALIPGPLGQLEGFEINGDGFSGPWLPFTSPGDTEPVGVWPIYNPQQTHFGLTLDAYGAMPPAVPFSHNAAIRPESPADYVTIRFDAPVVNLQQTMRLVAHLGFINGGRTPATASVQSRFVLTDPSQPSQTPSGIPAGPNLELLRIETDAPVTYEKLAGPRGAPEAMLRLELPLLVNTNEAQYQDALQGSAWKIEHIDSSNGLVPQQGLSASVTLMIQLDNPALSAPSGQGSNREAVGVFGVRIVPDTDVRSTGAPSGAVQPQSQI